MLEFIRRVRDIFRLVRAFDHSGTGRNAEALSILDTLESKWARNYLAAVLLRGTLLTLVGQHRESRACLLAAAQHIKKAKLSSDDERDYLTAYEGVDQSYKTAAEWYLKAAEAGFPPAQVNLGAMHEYGYRTPRSP